MHRSRVAPMAMFLLAACQAATPADPGPLDLRGPTGLTNGRSGVSVFVYGAYDGDPLEVRLATWPEGEMVDAAFAPEDRSHAIWYELEVPVHRV